MSQLPIPATPGPIIQQLGPYLVQKELGRNREGGRITYLATHAANGQSVVLKQFRFVQAGASWSGFKNHEREILILQAIAHPQVPRYLDSFETKDGFCMVQEYKDAPSLAEKTHLTPSQVQQIALGVLQVLADLQQQSPPIIHRDIKPENILVGSDFQIYLIDFGLAKVNHSAIALSSIAAGTPGFMPPEELFNRPLTTAADLYSVGATLIGLLTHKVSTDISTLLDENYRFNFADALPPINPQFIDWLQTMVEPNPRDRFPDAIAALQILETIEITNLSPKRKYYSIQNNNTRPQEQPISWTIVGLGVVGSVLSLQLISVLQKHIPYLLPTSTVASQSSTLRSREQQWYEAIKPQCNSLEVVTALQSTPYPETSLGAGLGASCYAIAGKTDLADQAIASLPQHQQEIAARILFEIGHPVADRGDDESAGPIMDLVLKYWPENYMARYHAGMSAYVLAENDKAIYHLEFFLDDYTNNDGWRQKALLALDNIQNNIPADDRFKVHH